MGDGWLRFRWLETRTPFIWSLGVAIPVYDADDPSAVVNEFLVTLFVPGIVAFVGMWVTFRLVLDDLLLSYGLGPIVPREGAGAVAAGYGRFLLVILVTVAMLLPYIGLYRRFLRRSLRERGLV